MRKLILFMCYQLVLLFAVQGQNKVSNKNSNWSDATAWTPSGVPTSTNNVTISDGNTITLDVNAVCNSILIGTGGSAATMRFTGNSPLTLSVTTNFTVNTNGTMRLRSSSNANHILNLKGNIINNGVFDLGRDANSTCDVVFSNNGNQSVSGIGSQTEFDGIILNMGNSVNNILDVTATSFTAPVNFLTLTNGTFKLSTPNALSIVPFTVTPTIPLSAGLWVNSATAVVSASAGINLSGKITVSAGTLNIGNASDEDLTVSGGIFVSTGGVTTIAGKFNASTSASTFSLNGGSVLVPLVGSTNTSIAPFHISAAGSQFHMTGGSIIITREGGTGAQDLGFVNTGSTAGAVTGGTLQLGNASSPGSQTLNINSTYSVANLIVNSVNVTAKITNNTLNISNNINVVSGNLNANNLRINLGGNWTNAGTFIAGSGIVGFLSNTSQSIFKSGGETFNHLLFNGLGIKTFSSTMTCNANFSVSSGATVDVSSSNFQLTLKGNFINDGTFITRNGLVLLNGTSNQNIGGTTISNFYNLSLNNAAGAILSANENLSGALTLSNGTFNVNSKVFTLISNSSGTARIAQITGTGDLSGNVTIERYIPGGATGWSLLGSPISSALTLNDLDDDIYIACPTCPDGNVAGFLSIYSYSESVAGVYDAAASYVGLSSINDPIVPGKGYWVYMGNNQFTTTAITIDLSGTVRKFNYNIPLNYTNYGSPVDDGWNLIHNPYPSAISWSALKGSNSNIDNAIYTYNADLNAGAGGFASYVNGVSSPAVASGGIDNNIPMFQGFYVHSTGTTSLAATEAIKVAGNPIFTKHNSSSNTPLVRLALNGAGSFQDETVLYFQPGASSIFDESFDAYKMRGQDPLAPSIALEEGNKEFQVNGISPIVGNFTMALKALTGYSGTYTLSINQINSLPAGACISLYDKFTASLIDLKSSDYIFNLNDTTTIARFILSITINTMTANSSIVLPTCQAPSGGKIVAIGANAGPWNYYWRTNGVLVQTSLNKSGADSLTQLNGGNYELEINTIGMCDFVQLDFTIDSKIVPVAQFSSIDTLYLSQSDTIRFHNTSINSNFNSWFFGNNSWFNFEQSPVQTYKSPGTYTVSLNCQSISGCNSSYSKVVTVIADNIAEVPTEEKSWHELLIKNLGNNNYQLVQQFNEPRKLNAALYDCNGKSIENFDEINSSMFLLNVSLKNKPSGIYYLRIFSQEEFEVVKLIAF